VCVCVSVSGVLFSVGVCVCDLLIFSLVAVWIGSLRGAALLFSRRNSQHTTQAGHEDVSLFSLVALCVRVSGLFRCRVFCCFVFCCRVRVHVTC